MPRARIKSVAVTYRLPSITKAACFIESRCVAQRNTSILDNRPGRQPFSASVHRRASRGATVTGFTANMRQPRLDPAVTRPSRALRAVLPTFADSYATAPRIAFDPIEFPRRYTNTADIETAGLIAACMAYGRASLFKPRIEAILNRMGNSPAAFAQHFARKPDRDCFAGITYRFNRPEDFAALVAGIGWMQNTQGGLGERFGALLREHRELRPALASFASELRDAPPTTKLLAARGHRGLRYLLTDASLPGACKRLHLYLRWMVRGPDGVDLGVWRKHVPASALIVPLDTHIARISRYLGLTARTDLSWRTAAEITEKLRLVDPQDPVRFDFALCHHGMSGACPPIRSSAKCGACTLRGVCKQRLSRTASARGESERIAPSRPRANSPAVP